MWPSLVPKLDSGSKAATASVEALLTLMLAEALNNHQLVFDISSLMWDELPQLLSYSGDSGAEFCMFGHAWG